MALSAWFRCLEGCEGRYPLTQAIYRCPRCGGLLDVAHDMDALRETSAAGWRELFDARLGRAAWPSGSGVWGKREWVIPGIDDADIVSMGEGRTSLLPAPRYAEAIGLEDVRIKMCGQSHTGSFKDLGMTVLVSVVRKAMREGLRARAIACASTGDTSASLAAYGAAAGLPVVVLLPRGKVSTAQLVQPIASGALVLSLDTDFDGCMAIISKLAEAGEVYLANSMNALRLEGQKTVAIEIAQDLGWSVPDWVVLPSGNLGNAYALYAGFRMMKDLGLIDRYPRLCAAQAERANPLYLAYRDGLREIHPVRAKETLASAIQIGNPVSAPRAMRALAAMDGVVEQASEDELSEAAALADRAGFYACPHTAVALAALAKLSAKGVVGRRDRVVVISTASGLKFTEFKVRYHEGSISGVSSSLANPPVEVAADYECVRERLASVRGLSTP